MATAVLPIDESQANDNDEHLELFSLIWLDGSANVKDVRDAQQKLRTVVNHLKKFQDAKECQQYIEQRSADRLMVIVSGQLGREVVPSIWKLQQVSSIYVYCMDKKIHEQWATQFAKVKLHRHILVSLPLSLQVKAVVSNLDELVSQMRADHKIQMTVEEPLPINLFTTSSAGKSTIGVNGQFVFSQVLIDCLLRMKFSTTDQEKLIARCETEYKGNRAELANLREFQQDYSCDKALWWYTRESFLYKILNATLRTQNIHMMFLFRSFILDIHRQLQLCQSTCPLRVFRCQIMSSDELNTLNEWIGQFISVNSFFSTSTDCSKALSFLGKSTISTGFERVLFEIDADPTVATAQSFADISVYSRFAAESEVLFMFGSIFRVNNICYGENQVWIIGMTLCSDNAHELKNVLEHIKNQNGSGETNLHTLAKVLWKMGKFDLAETYYCRVLKTLLPGDPLLITVYENLAEISSQKGDYDACMHWYQLSLQIKNHTQSIGNADKYETTDSRGRFFRGQLDRQQRQINALFCTAFVRKCRRILDLCQTLRVHRNLILIMVLHSK